MDFLADLHQIGAVIRWSLGRLAAIALSSVILSAPSACVTNRQKAQQAQQAQQQWDSALTALYGKEEPEVLQTLGAPDETLTLGDYTIWRYLRVYGTTTIEAQDGRRATVDERRKVVLDVYLKDHRVAKHTSRIE